MTTTDKVVPITSAAPKPSVAPAAVENIELLFGTVVPERRNAVARVKRSKSRIDEGIQSGRKYWILTDGSVGPQAGAAELPDDAVEFSTSEELRTITADWPMRRLVDVWNQLPGQRRLTRFENRTIALERLWQAIESLQLQPPGCAEKKAEKTKEERNSKTKRIVDLLQAPGGATLTALQEATGWQAHSVRGFLSGKLTKQMGLRVSSIRRNGERVYALAPQAPECETAQQAASAEIA